MGILKEKMQKCEPIAGVHVSLGDACISELLSNVGFDFLWIDTEHTAIDYQILQNHLIAARAGGTSTLVRIPWNDRIMAKRVLEMGPTGIIFPMINTAEEAEFAMKSCLYPPYGIRGFGPIRAVYYGQENNDESTLPVAGPMRTPLSIPLENTSSSGRHILKNAASCHPSVLPDFCGSTHPMML